MESGFWGSVFYRMGFDPENTEDRRIWIYKYEQVAGGLCRKRRLVRLQDAAQDGHLAGAGVRQLHVEFLSVR